MTRESNRRKTDGLKRFIGKIQNKGLKSDEKSLIERAEENLRIDKLAYASDPNEADKKAIRILEETTGRLKRRPSKKKAQ
jgi:hypothetical protein